MGNTAERKVCIIGYLKTSPDHSTTDNIISLGSFLREKDITLILSSSEAINCSLAQYLKQAGGKLEVFTLSNDKSFFEKGFLDGRIVVDNEVKLYEILFTSADFFIIFPGGVETLTLLAFLWNKNSVELKSKPIFLVGNEWSHFINELIKEDVVTEQDVQNTELIASIDDLIRTLGNSL